MFRLRDKAMKCLDIESHSSPKIKKATFLQISSVLERRNEDKRTVLSFFFSGCSKENHYKTSFLRQSEKLSTNEVYIQLNKCVRLFSRALPPPLLYINQSFLLLLIVSLSFSSHFSAFFGEERQRKLGTHKRSRFEEKERR